MRAAASVLAALLFALGGFLIAPAAAPQAQAAAGKHVMIENYAYSPPTLNVQAGETVSWTNHDEAKHDVVGAGFRSPLLAKGQRWSYTFPAAGNYSYYCSLHPDMRAKVTATPAPQPSPQQPTTQQPQQPAQQPQAASQPSSAGATKTPKSSAAASSAPPVAAPQPVQAAPQVVPAATQSIDPMLLVAGLVTGVAVLCLLLLGGRRTD